MANIILTLEEFEHAAEEIDRYVVYLKEKMSQADSAVSSMLSGWNGDDSLLFKLKWDDIIENGSTYIEMCDHLQRYAKFLRFSLDSYKTAQSKCIEQSKSLPMI